MSNKLEPPTILNRVYCLHTHEHNELENICCLYHVIKPICIFLITTMNQMRRLEPKGLTNIATVISAVFPWACVLNEGFVSSSGTAGMWWTLRV